MQVHVWLGQLLLSCLVLSLSMVHLAFSFDNAMRLMELQSLGLALWQHYSDSFHKH